MEFLKIFLTFAPLTLPLVVGHIWKPTPHLALGKSTADRVAWTTFVAFAVVALSGPLIRFLLQATRAHVVISPRKQAALEDLD